MSLIGQFVYVGTGTYVWEASQLPWQRHDVTGLVRMRKPGKICQGVGSLNVQILQAKINKVPNPTTAKTQPVCSYGLYEPLNASMALARVLD